jgi:hypothetical protein
VTVMIVHVRRILMAKAKPFTKEIDAEYLTVYSVISVSVRSRQYSMRGMLSTTYAKLSLTTGRY